MKGVLLALNKMDRGWGGGVIGFINALKWRGTIVRVAYIEDGEG